ncbi:MAG: rhomboid family intramembrane serine protease [Acetatifactor sp.]
MNRLKQAPVVSTALVIINVIVYILCIITRGMLYNDGILDAESVIYGKEYGRILWAMFFHADTSHLFNNMLILFFLGAMLEREIGHIRFGAFYFLSGIGGNILSLVMKVIHNDSAGSLGASGAVFGLDGVLLAMVILSGRRMESVTPTRVVLMIALSLYSGFTGGNVDNAAHVGGLIVGFLAGGIMCMIQNRKDRRQHEY